MKEWKDGRWTSQKQALAVSYNETRSHFKRKRMMKTKNKRKSRRKSKTSKTR